MLFDWLAQVARRQRWNQYIELGAKITFWLLALLLSWQVLRALIPVWQVTSALLPLLMLCGVGVLAWNVARALRAPTLADAAFTADRLGGWHDQLKSALWFARQPAGEPGVSVLLARARATVTASDPRRVLPLRITPMLYGAAGIALLSGLMAWWDPSLAHSGRQPEAGEAQAWKSAASTGQRSESSAGGTQANAGEARTAGGNRPTGGAPGEQTPLQSTQPAEGGAAAEDVARAPLPAQAGGDAAPSPVAGNSAGRGTRNPPPETSSEWLGSVVERLKEMMSKGDLEGDSTMSAAGEGQGDAKVNASERGNKQDLASGDPETRMRNADESGGSQLNLNALGGIGPRNSLPGDVMGEEQSGRNNSNSNSGPLGRRVSTSRGGPGDDSEAPKGDPGGNAESPAVMGRKTARLALQLRRVPSPAKSAGEQAEEAGSPEEFFAATRSQAARVALTPGAGAPRDGAGGDALSTEQTPLAYRAAVKDYFLSQHRKEK